MKKGTLYSLGKDAKLKGHISEIDFSNGLTWSPDNRTMYYNDSYSGVVAAFDFDIMDGKLSNFLNELCSTGEISILFYL